ncbi:hypothetical protein KFE98_17530 [bacterium SCSIO 12741]|nr:hypothetical protein KFE98_17530 [bacterium SCSIO 12741]
MRPCFARKRGVLIELEDHEMTKTRFELQNPDGHKSFMLENLNQLSVNAFLFDENNDTCIIKLMAVLPTQDPESVRVFMTESTSDDTQTFHILSDAPPEQNAHLWSIRITYDNPDVVSSIEAFVQKFGWDPQEPFTPEFNTRRRGKSAVIKAYKDKDKR